MGHDLRWQSSVPILGTPVIVRQLALAIGLPFGIVILVLLVASGGERHAWYGLGLVVLLLAATWLAVLILYGGRYDAEFHLDAGGALASLDTTSRKRSRAVSGLAVAAGTAAGQLAVAGAGVLAAGNQSQYLTWQEVRRVDQDRKHRTIVLRGPLVAHVALFCTTENFDEVLVYVTARVKS